MSTKLSPTSSSRSSWPTASVSMCSGSASTIGRTMRSPRPPWRSPPPPRGRSAFGSRAPSPCCRRTIRCASISNSRPSISSRKAAPRSWPGAARSSSPFRCSATTSTTTTSCLPRSSISCSQSALSLRSPGEAGIVRRSIGQGVYPRALQQPLPVWIASGGTPQSVARAGALGLPLAIAIIGGSPVRFGPLAQLYREAGRRAGVAPDRLKVGINGHGFLADTTKAAVEAFFGPYAEVMSRIGRERGWPPLSRAQFDQNRGPRGHLIVGTPDEAIAEILGQHEVFHHDRYLMQMAVGAQPQDAILRSIELLGNCGCAESTSGTYEAEGPGLTGGSHKKAPAFRPGLMIVTFAELVRRPSGCPLRSVRCACRRQSHRRPSAPR